MTEHGGELEKGLRRAGGTGADPLFDGAGDLRARCRAYDWSVSPLGPAATWPLSLRTIVATMLASRHPMFLFWGPEHVQLYNDAYRVSLGNDGRHPRALGARGNEFWTEIWDVIGPQIAQVRAGGEATWHENQFLPIHRNGRMEDVYWTYSYSPAFDDAGGVGGVFVVCQETTQQVLSTIERERLIEAERQARADADAARDAMGRVFAQAPVAVAVLHGRDLRFTVANPRYQQLIGNRDPVGKTMVEMFPDLAGSDIERVLEKVYDNGVPFVANDLLIKYDSQGTGGIDNYYDLVYHPLTADGGIVSGIIVVAVDVTERRHTIVERERLLNEAERSRADAEIANRSKSEFLAVMSHELRTPLNAIGGYAELIEIGIHGPVSPEQREALRRIQKSQRHLLGLVNGVLNYARVESGNIDYQLSNVPLDELLATCEALISPQARDRRLSLAFSGCSPDVTARADPQKLQQVVLNLLSNAVKFTEPGGEVALSCDAGDGVVSIRVRDTGHGILTEQLARIFEPFVQVDARLTRTQEGVGLGLAISRDLARGMGGDLTVESAIGVGSTFALTLPRSEPTSDS